MAGRYILMEFGSSAEADNFLESVQANTMGKVLAMFVKPTKFCECPDKRRQDARNWKRGKRTGLFLHTDCGRPTQFHQRGLDERMKHVLGYNLLEGVDING